MQIFEHSARFYDIAESWGKAVFRIHIHRIRIRIQKKNFNLDPDPEKKFQSGSGSGSRKALNPDPDPSYFFTLSEKIKNYVIIIRFNHQKKSIKRKNVVKVTKKLNYVLIM